MTNSQAKNSNRTPDRNFFFHYVTRDHTGKQVGGGSRRVEAPTIANAKRLYAASYPGSEVRAVSELIWEAPKPASGPKRPGQGLKEARERIAAYAKFK